MIKSLFILMILASCVPQQASNKRTASSTDSSSTNSETDSSETNAPTFSNTENFISYNGTKVNSPYNVTSNFDDSIDFRGSGIHTYIEANPSEVYCGIFRFESLTANKNLVVVGFPRSKIDFANNIKENYISWNFKTSQKDQNIAYCSNIAIDEAISLMGGGSTVYDIDDLCPLCYNETHTTSIFNAVTKDGKVTTSLTTGSLGIKVTFTNTPVSDTNLCSSDSQCQAINLDCCLNGQCVIDGSLKRSYTSSEPEYNDYLQALLDVSRDATNKSKYPEFYNICGQATPGSDTDTTDSDFTSEEQAMLDFQKLKFLYECITPQVGEMGICTTKYDKVDLNDSPFYAGSDDRDFSDTYTGTNGSNTTITEIFYQQSKIYEDGTHLTSPNAAIVSGTNDNLNDKMTVVLTKQENENNKFRDLIIRYKVDASCKEINSTMAMCYKEYIQGQNDGLPTDHFPASNIFKLPVYVDMSRQILVEVDGTPRKQGVDWDKQESAPSYIYFHGSSLSIFDMQRVKITYYVDTDNHPVLQSKKRALEDIGVACGCPANNCWLEPVYGQNETIVNYECKYPPPPVPEPPLQQRVQVSAKTAPHRHFDLNGVYKKDLNLIDISNEPVNEQEGTKFEYTNNNLNFPNNVSEYIGFNEIYGSFTYNIGSTLPAREVSVKKGTTYDISVQDGVYSSCFYCGADYYNNLVNLFPDSLGYGGGGYKPDLEATDRMNPGKYRADDLLFGRACFIPATMIPWSHAPSSNRQTQRLSRLAAQHALFANGYNRDWYGFDYGSLIGSFDGVRWFSIGTKRRIKATTNKLFIAVNAYFSDLTLENTYNVLVQDSIINGSSDYPTTDYESDGAQCQQVHACEKDSDCAAALGWDYACETVTGIRSKYPVFDENADEAPVLLNSPERLIALTGAFSGPSKRCVYRGKGAACTPNYGNVTADLSYNYSTLPRVHGCSSNNYCQALSGTAAEPRFNNAIVRYGKSIILRNNDDDLNLDPKHYPSGQLAPIIGRPQSFVGYENLTSLALNNLVQTNVKGMCIPGKRIPDNSNETLEELNYADPLSVNDPYNYGDRTQAIGVTPDTSVQSDYYLSQCPVFNENGNYVNYELIGGATSVGDIGAGDPYIKAYAASQNLSTRTLEWFEGLVNKKLLESYADPENTEVALYQRSCLRAPGATCFTNQDCGPSKFISDAIRSLSWLDLDDNNDNVPNLNEYEFLFWQEELVCSQPAKKGTLDFDIRKNRCCRESGNTITIPTATIAKGDTSSVQISENKKRQLIGYDTEGVPGVDTNTNDPSGYSRNATNYWDRNNPDVTDSTRHKTLSVAPKDQCADANGCEDPSTLYQQFIALDAIASRTCCSETWVRNFADGSHVWSPDQLQNPAVENFACINYTSPDADKQDCSDPSDPNRCTAIDLPEIDAKNISNWIAKFDMLGIPNIAIDDPNDNSAFKCNTDDKPIPGFISDPADPAEFQSNGLKYFKTTDTDNFNGDLKQVFSTDEFSCCLPAGTKLDTIDEEVQCCSGYANPDTMKCALRDYTDVTLYLNRYVSSEASTLPDSMFNKETGFIDNTSSIVGLACNKNLCASGLLAFGVDYGQYKFKGASDEVDERVNRFIENTNDDGDNYTGLYDFYNKGLRLHTHLYCVPRANAGALGTAGVQTFDCGGP
jgi:hypothetical protein